MPTDPPHLSENVIKSTVLFAKLKTFADDLKHAYDIGKGLSSSNKNLDYFRGICKSTETQFNKAENVWFELLALHTSNPELPGFPDAEQTKTWSNLKSYFHYTQYYYERHVKPLETGPDPGDSSVLSRTLPARAHLPKLNLPKFNGKNISDWPLFRDTFEALVNKDGSISPIEKYHFLVGALSGSALSIIKSIEKVEDNYAQAWESLMSHYDKKRRLAVTYLNNVLDFKPSNQKSTRAVLGHFLSGVAENITSLQNLKISNAFEYLLFELAIRGLDSKTREDFEFANPNVEFPTFELLLKFVKARHQALALVPEPRTCDATRNYAPAPKFQPKGGSNSRSALFSSCTVGSKKVEDPSRYRKPAAIAKENNSTSECFVCSARHLIKNCPTFKSAFVEERIDLLKEFKGCFGCLSPHHVLSECRSTFSCLKCKGKHNTMLCTKPNQNSPNSANNYRDNSPASASPPSNGASLFSPSLQVPTTFSRHPEVLLGTAECQIRDKKGQWQTIRLVVDNGSQFSFISKSAVERLGLQSSAYNKSVAGVGQTELLKTEGKVHCVLSSRTSLQFQVSTTAVIISTVTSNLPQTPLPQVLWQKYLQYDLADPRFWQPRPVDLLLGADVFVRIVNGGPISPYPDHPSLLPTIFGAVIIGPYTTLSNSEDNLSTPPSGLACLTTDLASIMKGFWEIEEINSTSPQIISASDQFCEDHFVKTHRRSAEGRFIVSLPFKEENPIFGQSKGQALSRLYNLEFKLSKNSSFHDQYHSFLKEYLDLGHMSLASNPGEFIIPHHGIYKSGDTSGKIRVVFDGSARTSKGSLNEKLHIGPKLQNDICQVLLNFRKFAHVFVADISKFYRQILVQESDRKFQHILWRFDRESPVQEYELSTVTYGLSPSAFQAIRCLRALVEYEGHNYPRASAILLHSTYMDDCCAGANTLEEAQSLKEELTQLLKKGCFELSKWSTNSPELLRDIPNATSLPLLIRDDKVPGTKILGMQWDPIADVFSYSVHVEDNTPTRRSIMSMIARLYDPLGYLAPIIINAKVILQEVWKLKGDWNDPVPENINNDWQVFMSNLPDISQIKIPRYLMNCTKHPCDVFGFCDASQRGYCAAIYLRVEEENGIFRTFLLKSKTKVAPLKECTIPRLELCGALLLARLYESITSIIDSLQIQHVNFFTDSQIVLGWINTPLELLKIYVAHRVGIILEKSKLEWWNKVVSAENPADCGSRGLLPHQLANHSLWWAGPHWISFPSSEWPSCTYKPSSEILPEIRPKGVSLAAYKNDEFIELTETFSSYSKFVNVVAIILRFGKNCRVKDKAKRASGPINFIEFQEAKIRCILLTQQHYFGDKKCLKVRDLFACLNVFKDERVGLFRVGGRLLLSNLPFFQRHPILLPKEAHLTSLLMRHYHYTYMHPGNQALHAYLQSHYWIPCARSLLKQMKRKCVTCRRFTKEHLTPYMGNIPASRFTQESGFHHTGVDMCGPFLCRESSRKNATVHKAYVCLFICFSSKALHLEVIPSLSTEAFLNALDCFISRRGIPARVFSDCGTNFKGTVNYLADVQSWMNERGTRDAITNYCTPKCINWTFNPPRSPHFGGLWEAGVKSVKSHFYKTLGNQRYTERELTVVVTKIEGILNSRPLIPVSSDPNDPQPLTPAHLLIGKPITQIPEPDFSETPENRLSRWQFLRQRVQHFWNAWKRDYLQSLQERQKWRKCSYDLKVEDIVLVKDADSPPFEWPLARIVEVHPGVDGIVRAVTLRTQKGLFKRSTVNLILLHPIP